MDIHPTTGAPRPGAASDVPSHELAKLREAAVKLEASFLAEMLKGAGLGEPRESFGGGAGEEHYSSFLRQAQAEKIAQTGGIGLAETIFESMRRGQNV